MRGLAKRKLLILLLSLLVVASGVYAVLRLIPQSPMLYYFKAETRYITGFTDKLKSDYKRMYQEKEPYIKEPVRIKTQVFWDFKPESQQDAADIGIYSDIVNKLSLVADSSINRNAGKVLSDISLNLEGIPIVAGRFIKDAGNVYLNVPAIFKDKYIKADTSNMARILENLGVSETPGDVQAFFEYGAKREPVQPSLFNEKVDTLLKKLGMEAVAYVGKDNVKFGKVDDAEIALWGSGVKKVEISLEPEKVKGFLLAATDIAAEEGLFDIPGYFIGLAAGGIGFDLSEFKEPALTRIRDFFDGIEFVDPFFMEVLIDKQENIVSRDAILKVRDPGTGRLFRAELSASSQKFVLTIYEIHDSGESLLLDINIDMEKVEDENAEIYNVGFDADIGLNGDGLHLHAGFEIEKKPAGRTGEAGGSVKYEAVFSTTGAGAGSASEGKISGRIDTSGTIDEKNRIHHLETKTSMDIDIPAAGQNSKISLAFRISREDMLGIADFDLPYLDGVNVVDLNNITGEELEQLRQDIMMSISLLLIGSGMFTF